MMMRLMLLFAVLCRAVLQGCIPLLVIIIYYTIFTGQVFSRNIKEHAFFFSFLSPPQLGQPR